MKNFPTWLGHIIAAILSLGVAFFGVAVILFSDTTSQTEKITAILGLSLVYAIIGAILGGLWPAHIRAWRLWLIIPAGVATVFFGLLDSGDVIFPLLTLGAVVGGAWIGSTILNRQKHNQRPPLNPPS